MSALVESQPFVLAELDDLSAIFSPLKTTSRIKYTSFNVSKNFLIFGATSGGVYIFKREPCVFLQVIPNKEGAITQVAMSSDEKIVAFSTVKGVVCAVEHTSTNNTRHLISSFEHQNSNITVLQWNNQNDEIFIGDDSGKVSVLCVPVFMPKNMFQTPTAALMQLDSKIVQLDIYNEMLLVSTLTRCYICDTSKELFRQVGHKLRDGEYGACILSTEDNIVQSNVRSSPTQQREKYSSVNNNKNAIDYPHLKHLKLFCARPGSRLWEVSINGVVLNTLHFKQALQTPSVNVIFQNENESSQVKLNSSSTSETSFNFPKLYVILNKYLFTFKNNGLYVMDPAKANILLWTTDISNIVDAKCINDSIYVWCENGKMFALNVIQLEKFLIRLYFRKKFLTTAKLCLKYSDYLKVLPPDSRLHLLSDLDQKLSYCDQNVLVNLKPVLEIFSKLAQDRQVNSHKLNSGIFLVSNNVHYNGKIKPSYLSSLNMVNDKNRRRSHSTSPEKTMKNGSVHGSTTSLDFDVQNDHLSLLTTSQDTVQALRDLSNTVTDTFVNSTKHFRDKWHLIEDKMKLLGQENFDNEPFDIKSSEYVSEVEKEQIYPDLDTSEVINTCNSPTVDYFEFFSNILKLQKLFEIKMKTNSIEAIIDLSITNEHLWETLNIENSFPFLHYFTLKYQNIISSILQQSIYNGTLKSFLEKYSLDVELDLPYFILQKFTIESLKIDFKLSQILKLFKELLTDVIINDIKFLSLNCYFFSLSELVKLNIINEQNESILNQVYNFIKCNEIVKCLKYVNRITTQVIYYLLLCYQYESFINGKSIDMTELQCQTLFLTYIDGLSENIDVFSDENWLIIDYIQLSLENLNCTASINLETKCKCGFPIPGMKPSLPLFADVGSLFIERMWSIKSVKCVELCGKVPYFWRYLVKCRQDESVLSVLPLIIQLGDFNELDRRTNELNVNLLEVCVRHLIGSNNHICLNCGHKFFNNEHKNPITWTQFGMLCVKTIGPQDCLELFTKYSSDIETYDIDQSLYQCLVFSTVMEKHCKGLRKNVVHLLTNKVEAEPGDLQQESAPKHWGVKLNTKNPCLSCMLPLNSKVLCDEGGLKIFKCRHSFHAVCLKTDNVCPICL